MDGLVKAIHSTPIIDNHAHPLLIASARAKYPLLAITTEAHGDAMKAATSTLSHLRAVNQLSQILGCPATWGDVVKAIEVEKEKPNDVWAKRCLEGIETILVDDGLDGKDEVFDYAWHDRLTRSKCKRIVRIVKVAEEIIDKHLKQSLSPDDMFTTLVHEFESAIKDAVSDPEVVGFKSVICYRTGLNVSTGPLTPAEMEPPFIEALRQHKMAGKTHFKRLDGLLLNSYLVDKTASIIQSAPHKKPFQFHTGLGDNDITLTRSSPSHLQDFVRKYPNIPIVLLHASYPWTKEAGYLASVYENVYADIGEVFPFLSKEGQENVVREILELCPSEKILWSTDGHWFPETYLLAIIQVREALEVVLPEYVRNNVLSVSQAIKIVEDFFFHTSNKIYDLKLPLKPLNLLKPLKPTLSLSSGVSSVNDVKVLTSFLRNHSRIKFVRLQYLDYTATPRLRVIPTKRALNILEKEPHLNIGITKASLGLLQNDTIIPGVSASGEYRLRADFSSMRAGPTLEYASLQGEFYNADGSEVALCPRSTLRRTIEKAKSLNLEFLLGFEIEIVFMNYEGAAGYQANTNSGGHAWSSARALQGNSKMLTEVYDSLSSAGIHLEQWHPEGATGQFEFVLPPLPPLEAIDTLIHSREIISTVVSNYGMRATLYPKPFPMQCGTASHVHISISSPNGKNPKVYESFYAGILESLQGIIAFTYSSPASYDRMVDGCWAGGTWVAWGTQNRETPLRKVDGSHWEIKCLDGLANVYLAMAAILGAGTAGVVHEQKMIWRDCQKDPADLSDSERKELGVESKLPKDLSEALIALKNDQVLVAVLGEEVVARYSNVKIAEMKLLDGMDPHNRKQWIIERY